MQHDRAMKELSLENNAQQTTPLTSRKRLPPKSWPLESPDFYKSQRALDGLLSDDDEDTGDTFTC